MIFFGLICRIFEGFIREEIRWKWSIYKFFRYLCGEVWDVLSYENSIVKEFFNGYFIVFFYVKVYGYGIYIFL